MKGDVVMSEELHNDIGHGKNTYPPSKGVPGLPEYSFNSAVAAETKRLLAGKVPTYEAQPFNGNDVPLITRTNRYNARYYKNRKAIGISHHANANSKKHVRGFGVFYWHTSPEAEKLAKIILSEYKKEFPDRDKYPIWGDGLFPSVPGTWTELHMCRETAGVFVLVEWEFMTNSESLKLLKSSDYRKRCGLVTAKSVCRWYGIKWPEKPANIAKEEDEMLEEAVLVGAFPDIDDAELVCKRLQAPLFFRGGIPNKKVAKKLYVVGGTMNGLDKYADELINLSGKDRAAVTKAVENFLK